PLKATGGFTLTGPVLNNFVLAADVIRGRNVTGVQTCALPIFSQWGDGTTSGSSNTQGGTISGPDANGVFTIRGSHTYSTLPASIGVTIYHEGAPAVSVTDFVTEIGRASCREGVYIRGVGGQSHTNSMLATFISTGNQECPG